MMTPGLKLALGTIGLALIDPSAGCVRATLSGRLTAMRAAIGGAMGAAVGLAGVKGRPAAPGPNLREPASNLIIGAARGRYAATLDTPRSGTGAYWYEQPTDPRTGAPWAPDVLRTGRRGL